MRLKRECGAAKSVARPRAESLRRKIERSRKRKKKAIVVRPVS